LPLIVKKKGRKSWENFKQQQRSQGTSRDNTQSKDEVILRQNDRNPRN
jgi:hypothetical protein